MQRGRDFAAFAGALAMQQCHRDRGKQIHAGHLVALRRQREGGRAAGVGERIEQARAREECRRVEARLLGVRSLLAVAGHRGIDQARVERRHVGVAHLQSLAHLERKIHHHHVGGLHQTIEGGAAVGVLEVEHDRALVAVDQVPAEIDRMLRDRMRLSQLALRIALARRLDLDHLGAVIAHHRGRHGAGDEARQIENAQALQRQGAGRRWGH